MKTRHYGYFDERGKLHATTFVLAVNKLRERRVPVVFTVGEHREQRSNQANKYYWSVVVELIYLALKESGWEVTREGTHELLRVRFLSEDRPIGNDGEFVTRVKSTTELDGKEFGEYVEACKRFAAEYLNVVVPEPNEQIALEV